MTEIEDASQEEEGEGVAVRAGNGLVTAALEYASLGWKVVPLVRKQKRPIPKSWQTAASSDREAIARWWRQTPKANVGVKLGPDSGIIDIECDDEAAETKLLELFDDRVPATPTCEASRGCHRLFRWRDDLPHGKKNSFKIGALEFRTGCGGKGAQSVFPPSIHPTGRVYRWIIHPADVEPAEIPDEVVAKLHNYFEADESAPSGSTRARKTREPEQKEWMKFRESAVPEGGRDSGLLSYACRHAAMIGNFNDPQCQADLYDIIAAMNLLKCKPPLDDDSLRRIHDQAIKYTRKDRAGDDSGTAGFTLHGLRFEDGQWLPGEWKLTVILSDPVRYRLHVPRWKDRTQNNDGNIVLTNCEYRDASKVAAAIQGATKGVVLDDVPRAWPAIWNGSAGNKREGTPPRRGIKAILLDNAETEEPPPIDRQFVVTAEYLVDQLNGALDANQPEPRKPVMVGADYWFRWQQLWQNGILEGVIEKGEPNRLAELIGLGTSDFKQWPTNWVKGKSRHRYCVLKPKHRTKLDEILNG